MNELTKDIILEYQQIFDSLNGLILLKNKINNYKLYSIDSFVNSHGQYFTEQQKFNYLSYLNNPTLELWKDIYHLQVFPKVTLLDCWSIYSNHSKKLNNDFPSPDYLRESILFTLNFHYKELENNIEYLSTVKNDYENQFPFIIRYQNIFVKYF